MARPHSRRFLPASHPLAIALGLLAAAACAPAGDANGEVSAGTSAAPQSQTPQPGNVRPGIEVLLTDSLSLVRGRRAGLITNHTGRDRSGTPSIDLLADHPEVELVALFSPEHGIRGSAEAGVRVESGVDERTGLPVHSLYGEIRAPTPEMLDGIEVLLFDIQDIGTRYYTYLSTMALAMEAAGAQGIPFVVLDRPNPIGGDPVHGNILDPAFSSFVGLYPIPMRHGLTAGEFARMAVGEFGVQADLSVAALDGWNRTMPYGDTGIPWIAPSPNMPSVESALHYPGTCLFEGTPISVGRGTDIAFQQVGAPWLDGEALAARSERARGAGRPLHPRPLHAVQSRRRQIRRHRGRRGAPGVGRAGLRPDAGRAGAAGGDQGDVGRPVELADRPLRPAGRNGRAARRARCGRDVRGAGGGVGRGAGGLPGAPGGVPAVPVAAHRHSRLFCARLTRPYSPAPQFSRPYCNVGFT